jgi:hypothetical protein
MGGRRWGGFFLEGTNLGPAGTRVAGCSGGRKENLPRILPAAIAGAAGLLGCGGDCREAARLGEFELSQGNYERAILQFEKAWDWDSAGCPGVKQRLLEAREFRDKALGR